MKEKETVEQFLARGGLINEIPRGESAQQIKLKRHSTSKERATYVTGASKGYNNKRRET
jgi:hypothetical protein